jgi:hypothetical protein
MQELLWLIEPLQVWLHGGTIEEITRTEGFMAFGALFVVLVPGSVIWLLLSNGDWRETALARYLGQGKYGEDNCWPETPEGFGEGPLEGPQDRQRDEAA